MKCTDLEALLCDYVDGTLTPLERATVELHLAGCEDCRLLMEDARAAVGFMERCAAPEPPPALVNGILFELRNRTAAANRRGASWWAKRLLEPVLQPRFAMGMAMTILSFSMLGRFAGIPVRQLKASDLEPAKVWQALDDKLHRSWERAVKYYENLRLVYEIQSTLSDWSDNGDAAAPQTAPRPAEGPIEKKAPPAESSAGAQEGVDQ
jgi:hypothetical protein